MTAHRDGNTPSKPAKGAVDCQSAMRQLFDYLDGELTGDRLAAVRDHVRDCSACYPHYDFEKLILDTLGELRETGAAPGGLRARVMQALERDGLGRR